MIKPKLIITDLDDTALDSPGEKVASERLKNAIERLEATGIKISAATGRAQSFAKIVVDSMGLKHPIIVSGGSRIIDPVTDEELWGKVLSKQQMDAIIAKLKGSDHRFLLNEWSEEEYLGGAFDITHFMDYKPTYIFVICFVDGRDLQKTKAELSKINNINVIVASSHREGTYDIHITHKLASKEHAVKELCSILKISQDSTVGIGDGHNDIHLFKGVGYKVAMGNAVDDLKKQADAVIGSVQEDGLAKYFETIVAEQNQHNKIVKKEEK